MRITEPGLSKERLGFTLIETLVVIGILAVLAGILVPVLLRAKVGGYKTTAISNVQQLYTGVSLYMVDTDDRYPVESWPNRYKSQMAWPQNVSRYVSKITPTGVNGIAIDDDLPKIFFDPKKPYLSQRSIGDLKTAGISGWGLSDDVSNQFSPTWDRSDRAFGPPHFGSEVKKPSDCLLLTETLSISYRPYPGNAQAISPLVGHVLIGRGNTDIDAPYGDTRNETYNHGQKTPDPNGLNVTIYCDGHVRLTRLSEIIENGKLWSIGGNGQWP